MNKEVYSVSDAQKTIQILQGLPSDISSSLSMREIFETLTIMLNLKENSNFEPTTKDFLEALLIRKKIQKGLEDIENGNVYTTDELLNLFSCL